MGERPMIVRITTTGRPQQWYDDRLQKSRPGTGDVTIATELAVPRSTAPGRLGRDRRRGEPRRDGSEGIGAPARSPGAPATREETHGTPSARPRLASKLGIHPDTRASARRTWGRAREFVPLLALLRILRWSPSRFHAWRRLPHARAPDDQSSCPHTSKLASDGLPPPEVENWPARRRAEREAKRARRGDEDRSATGDDEQETGDEQVSEAHAPEASVDETPGDELPSETVGAGGSSAAFQKPAGSERCR
jgi:hypothetical protein